ncbi:hypothetical protein Hypma_005910 [Hypsizygus marmoreus]|uniref:Uncharacterized protein n=1 Tax=Hypsizygus marmoreus TaxID=39966 RepID=A0A369KAA7_HYPMA|nr:hypothetical protein Hypma_005910 [Hypsizygus marmoreus]
MSENVTTFSFGERLGIFLMVESAGLSAIAVSILLAYVAYKTFKRYRTRRALRRHMRQEWLNASQMSADHRTMHGGNTDASDSSFFICLMLAELVQAIGLVTERSEGY